MAQSPLVTENIDAGAVFLKALDTAGENVMALAWLLVAQDERYKLMVALQTYDNEGARQTYGRLLDVFSSSGISGGLTPVDFMAVSPGDPRVQMLGVVSQTDSKASARIRVTNSTVNNYVVDDALIYRMAP